MPLFPITVVTRAAKGSPLNATEHDSNLLALKAAAEDLNTRVQGVGSFSGNATKIGGTNVASIAPINGQVLAYNSANGRYEPISISGGGEPLTLAALLGLLQGALTEAHLNVSSLNLISQDLGNITDGVITFNSLVLDSDTESLFATVGATKVVTIGKLDASSKGIRITKADGTVLLDVNDQNDMPYLRGVVSGADVESALDGLRFQYDDWAQFAVQESFDGSTYGVWAGNPAAVIANSRLVSANSTANALSNFQSVAMSNMNVVSAGPISSTTNAGVITWTFANAFAFDNQFVGYYICHGGKRYQITATNAVAKTATTTTSFVAIDSRVNIEDNPPDRFAAYAYLQDALNGGYGYVKIYVSFNNGANYTTVYDSENNVQLLGCVLPVNPVLAVNPLQPWIVRIQLKNDAQGRSPIVFSYMVAANPSIWKS